jgi:hypothetical protein
MLGKTMRGWSGGGFMSEVGGPGGGAVSDEAAELAEATDPEGGGDLAASRGAPAARRRRLSCLAAGVAVLAMLGGGVTWLFQDELFHPFGDPRACEGSDTSLPNVISAGGAPLPTDASEIHYATKNGTARVSFRTTQLPDYLHRTGLVPEGEPLLDERYGDAYALGTDETELPKGLCGPALRGPAWSYFARGAAEPGMSVLAERSPIGADNFRDPARVIVTFDVG